MDHQRRPGLVHFSAASSAALAVTSIVPDGSEPLDAPPPQIMVAFNHELDMTQLATHAIRIERLNADGSAPTGIVPVRLSISAANLRTFDDLAGAIARSRPLPRRDRCNFLCAIQRPHRPNRCGRCAR